MKPAGRTKDFSIQSILADKPAELVADDRYGMFRSRVVERFCENTDVTEEECVKSSRRRSRFIEEELQPSVTNVRNSCVNYEQKTESRVRENPTEDRNEIVKRNRIRKLNENQNKKLRSRESNETERGISVESQSTVENDPDGNEDVTVNRSKVETEERTFSRVQRPEELVWLRYTRYEPPKLRRGASAAANKRRKPSLHPRIPFSPSQLDILEKRFQQNAYLTKNDVMEISMASRLPINRVKIWFQNRRARERRESNNKM